MQYKPRESWHCHFEICLCHQGRRNRLIGVRQCNYKIHYLWLKLSTHFIYKHIVFVLFVQMDSLQMVALGRPFDLGMLYDCRSDKLIPGITLWDKEKLDRDMRERPQPNSEFRIVASESISDKSSSLGVEASLKASFLCGLVDVEGSAKYLKNEKKVHQTGQSHSVMIKKIPEITIEGSGALKMEDKEREKANKCSCTFHGDFLLEKSPTTFKEAVKVYQDLPRLLGPNKENVVPVTVYLLPLSVLDSKASKLVRQISLKLVTKAENILEGFTELEMWCNDVLKSPAGQMFPKISKIKTFKRMCSEFKLGLQRTLSQKLPLIRGGGEGEAALAEVLKKVAQGPFNSDRLKQWMEDKDDETNAVKSLMKLMQNTETVSSKNALSDKVSDSEKALVFVLTSLDSTEPFLSELEQHLKGSKSDSSDAPEPRRWYSSEDMIYTTVRRKAKLFSDFAEANKDKDRKIAATFLTILDYGDLIYMTAPTQVLKLLDSVYHASLRFITNCKPRTHHCELYTGVGWPALETHRLTQFMLIYKGILRLLPISL
uniref:Uncharacterized protein n=1 Tax=Neogobius melanostomus TaxID=47308 RepID=A0A8C6SI16_9GOBI